jgi:hypothetical protein
MAAFFKEAWENLATLVKRTGGLDIFQSKTEFRAQVLTHPVAYAGPEKATSDPQTRKKLEGIPSQKLFMCRILDDQMAHNKFLTDPCLIDTTSDVENTALLTSLHTRATLSTADTNKPIQPGDYIYVTADPGDNNMPYDLQNVAFSRVDVLFGGQSPKLTEACQSLADLFGEGTPRVHAGPELSSNLVADDEYVNITPVSTNVVATLPINNFLDKLRTKILASEIKEIIITSGLRTPSAQASALYYDRKKSGCSQYPAVPIGSKAHPGPCWPHYSLYTQKKLIMEVIRVDNDVSAMTAVLENQVSRGRYLSPHMRGMGVDIRVSNLSDEQEAFVMKRTKELGGAPVHEGDHIHVGIPDSYGSPQVS